MTLVVRNCGHNASRRITTLLKDKLSWGRIFRRGGGKLFEGVWLLTVYHNVNYIIIHSIVHYILYEFRIHASVVSFKHNAYVSDATIEDSDMFQETV